MKRGLPYLLLPALITLAVLSGCAYITGEAIPVTTTPHPVITNVSPFQAYDLIIQTNTKFIILDVRTPAEYAEGQILNAVNVDFTSPNFKDEVGRLDKNVTYLVYCRTGARSAAAAEIMKELGFKDIYNMNGGITEWQSAGLPVIK
jgi:rhodanese-related sulfurtransferase